MSAGNARQQLKSALEHRLKTQEPSAKFAADALKLLDHFLPLVNDGASMTALQAESVSEIMYDWVRNGMAPMIQHLNLASYVNTCRE